MINQGVARAFARVRRPGVLAFAAVSEVGVSGRRVDGGHSLNSQKCPWDDRNDHAGQRNQYPKGHWPHRTAHVFRRAGSLTSLSQSIRPLSC